MPFREVEHCKGKRFPWWTATLLMAVILLTAACASDKDATPTPKSSVLFPTNTPQPLTPPTPSTPRSTPRAPVPSQAGLNLPPGFGAEVFVSELSRPTSMAFSPDGVLFVSQENGSILAISDTGSDGQPKEARDYARGFQAPLGLAFHHGDLYVSSRGAVHVIKGPNGDGQANSIQRIISGLPNGRHQNNGLAFGPDGKLYMGVGSTCDACDEDDPRSATIMRFNPDGTGGEVYARGLRNVYDLAFAPVNGSLLAPDNGRDDQGLDVPEELNIIEEGGHFGWPGCWGTDRGDHCQGTNPPLLELEPRSSPDGLAFYTGDQLPPGYRNSLFIAMWGSHSGLQGRKVIRVSYEPNDPVVTASQSDFALGFDRPLDLVVSPDGSLLVADYGRGIIYRIFWQGEAAP